MNQIQIYKWPIEPKYKILEHDKYGMRKMHQILKKPRFHSGFDITAETLTEVYPASRGTVIFAGLDTKIASGQDPWNHRYGNMITILDEYDRKIIYAHLRDIYVQPGDTVDFNDLIARTGCSGGARIPHLHFEIRKNIDSHSGEENTINPLSLLPARDLDKLTEEFCEEPYASIWRKMIYENEDMSDYDIWYSNDKKYIR